MHAFALSISGWNRPNVPEAMSPTKVLIVFETVRLRSLSSMR
jgi:hypothetical protein